MRNVLFAAMVVPCLLVGVSTSVWAGDSLPSRKPGLWEMTISGRGQRASVTKQCVDASTDTQMQEQASQMGKTCTKQEVKKQGDSYVIDADCTFGTTRAISHGVTTGDFNSGYETEVSVKYDPPMMGLKDSTTKISARWLGPCEAGQQPGDIILPNGMKVNVNALGQMGQSER